jgi:large subunit ribosomal protein L21
MTYAVIATGGKQYKVSENEIVKVERILGDVGSKASFDKVIMIGGDGSPKLGKPYLSGATVECEIVAHDRHDKVLVFKKKRRKGYKKIRGHRQAFTAVKIAKINA